jgi:hypothetical protein
MNPFAGVSTPQRLLIIAPAEFMPALQPLVQHKNQIGMPAFAVTISSLTPTFQGADDPETIKQAIRYAHENLSTKYVMLVGDAHWFPVRFYFLHNLTGHDFSAWAQAGITVCSPLGDWFASDLYYANLYHHIGPAHAPGPFDNWDATGNGLYNEVDWNWDSPQSKLNPNPDNVDGYPDMAVGRVPAHSAADVTVYVNKVIAYESDPARRFTSARAFTFVNDKQYDGGHLDWVDPAMTKNTGLMAGGLVSARFLFVENQGGNPPPGWTNASPVDVANAATQSDWVSYIGHGSTESWEEFNESNVTQTANSNAWPVVFAIGCSTGGFISDFPWNADYVDVSGDTTLQHGNHGPLLVYPGSAPGADGPVILDARTGQRWGVNCPPPGCDPLPANVPTPNPYDYDRKNQCFAYPWLITNAPGGAIAYFGEIGIAQNNWGADLERFMLAAYAQEADPVLGDIYLKAQQRYWPDHTDGGPHGGSRFYLGWMVFFGDPSLRLPRILDPCDSLRKEIAQYEEALTGGELLPKQQASVQAVLGRLRRQLIHCETKYPRR